MHEGNADEEGSLSFGQVLFRYRYSDEPCTFHSGSGLNYFDPEHNLMSFGIHTAGPASGQGVDVSCGGSFWRGFNSRDLGRVHQVRPQSEQRQTGDLVGFRHGDGPVHTFVSDGDCSEDDPNDCEDLGSGNWVSAAEDEYEILAKAMTLYNGASNIIGGLTWAQVLQEADRASQRGVNVVPEEGRPECYSCMYSIEIRNDTGQGPDGVPEFGLPTRAYIWYGGEWPETVPDEEDEEGNPVPHPNAGEDWCFAYGEREWRGGGVFADALEEATGDPFADPPVEPVGRIDCESGDPYP